MEYRYQICTLRSFWTKQKPGVSTYIAHLQHLAGTWHLLSGTRYLVPPRTSQNCLRIRPLYYPVFGQKLEKCSADPYLGSCILTLRQKLRVAEIPGTNKNFYALILNIDDSV